ncbi:MAG: superinfection immunity protein [Polyangiaceae bacterium]|nr:superinfection immunity protein [Polyangiaceae bacterium]
MSEFVLLTRRGYPLDPLGTKALTLIVTCLLVTYFIPTITAVARRHQQWLPIALVNLFLGWTIFGWVAGLIWSVTGSASSQASPAAGQVSAGVLAAGGLTFAFATVCGVGLWWQQGGATLAEGYQQELGGGLSPSIGTPAVPTASGPSLGATPQPGPTIPSSPDSSAVTSADPTGASIGSALAPGIFDPNNVWVYRVTRTADRPSTDEMSPLVYYRRVTPAPGMDASAQRFAYLRQEGGDTVERVMQVVSAEHGSQTSVLRMVTGGSGDLPMNLRALVVEGTTYNVFGGELLDGTGRSPTRRTTYFDPRVGIVHEAYSDGMQGYRRSVQIDLVAARVGGSTWGDVDSATPGCDTQRTVFRDRGLLANEFSEVSRTFSSLRVGSASGYREISFDQQSGTVSMYGDGNLLVRFPRTQFYAAKSIPDSDGQLVVVELDGANGRVELHFIWISRRTIRRREFASVAFDAGERVGVFRIPYERTCVYEVRSFEQSPTRVRVARLHDDGQTLQIVGGTLPIRL